MNIIIVSLIIAIACSLVAGFLFGHLLERRRSEQNQDKIWEEAYEDAKKELEAKQTKNATDMAQELRGLRDNLAGSARAYESLIRKFRETLPDSFVLPPAERLELPIGDADIDTTPSPKKSAETKI